MPTDGTGILVGAVVKRLRHPYGSCRLSEFEVLPILPTGILQCQKFGPALIVGILTVVRKFPTLDLKP